VQLLESALKPSMSAQGTTLYVRIFQDEVSISLDLSGEHLHLRGNKKNSVAAPLRSTLANYLVRKMLSSAPRADENVWVDACAGSGTIALEIENYQFFSKREFAFQNFKNTPRFLKDDLAYANYMIRRKVFKEIHAVEKDPKVFKTLSENLTDSQIQSHCVDFLKFDLQKGPSDLIFLIANPPYGVRIQSDLKVFDLLQKSKEIGVSRLGVLHPEDFSKLKFTGWDCQGSELLSNGGVPVHFTIWDYSATSNSA
jgi:putative N6-adenine-specific DNA methylase